MKQRLSGANVVVWKFMTVKWGDSDVGRQALNMRRAANTIGGITPPIFCSWRNGFICKTMEVAYPETWDYRKAELALQPLWRVREEYIYHLQPKFTAKNLYEFLYENSSVLLGRVPSVAELDVWYGDAHEATHGDCTLENTLVAADRTYRFIDWQPFRRPFVPAHRDVDYGKMIQSVLGWPSNPRDPAVVWIRPVMRILEQHPNAWLWACVHYERIKLRVTSYNEKTECDRYIRFVLSIKDGLEGLPL